MATINTTTPLEYDGRTLKQNSVIARGKNTVPAAGYEAKINYLANVWGVDANDLYPVERVRAVQARDEHNKVIADNADLTPDFSTADTPAKRNAAAKKIVEENKVRAAVRAGSAQESRRIEQDIRTFSDPELTFNQDMRTLPVADEVAVVRELGPFLSGHVWGADLVASAEETQRVRALVREYLPIFERSMLKLLALDVLLPASSAFALYTDPGIEGRMMYRANYDDRGNRIPGREDQFTADDVRRHEFANRWKHIYAGDIQSGLPGGWIPDGDRAVTVLAQEWVEGMTLSIPSTFAEFRDRVERFASAGFESEDVENRMSKDVYEDKEFWRKNRETDQFEPWVTRTNLRTGEGEQFRVGGAVAEPTAMSVDRKVF